MYKSQQERTFTPIRKKTKKILVAKAKKKKISQIDLLDLVIHSFN